MKEEGTSHWQSPNRGATNESGFTALPAAYRTEHGKFFNLGLAGYFRSANEHWIYQSHVYWLYYDYNEIRSLGSNKENGYSVRCVKD